MREYTEMTKNKEMKEKERERVKIRSNGLI